MSIHTVSSSLSYKLYLASAILMIIETVVLYVSIEILGAELPIYSWMELILAALFFVGAIFAKTGFGITGTTRRSVGGGWYEETAETANAITCGCMTGLAVLILAGYTIVSGFGYLGTLVIIGAFPAVLSGILAMLAGIVSMRATYGRVDTTPEPLKIIGTSTSCPYCGKSGISPNAVSCPNCGEPLR